MLTVTNDDVLAMLLLKSDWPKFQFVKNGFSRLNCIDIGFLGSNLRSAPLNLPMYKISAKLDKK